MIGVGSFRRVIRSKWNPVNLFRSGDAEFVPLGFCGINGSSADCSAIYASSKLKPKDERHLPFVNYNLGQRCHIPLVDEKDLGKKKPKKKIPKMGTPEYLEFARNYLKEENEKRKDKWQPKY